MGETKRKAAAGHDGSSASNNDNGARIEFFGRGFLLDLSRRAKFGCAWANDRLRIVAEATERIEARKNILCAACDESIRPGSFPEGFALLYDMATPDEKGGIGTFAPLCPHCASLNARDAIKRIGANLGIDIALTRTIPIGDGSELKWRRPQSIEEAIEQVARMISGDETE